MTIIYKIGDPKETKYVQQLMLISGLIDKSTSYFLTSTHYKAVMAEFEAQYRDALMYPELPAPWDTRRDSFRIGSDPCLTVINSGTEDQDVCNLLNEEPARVANFGARRDALIKKRLEDAARERAEQERTETIQ